MAKRPATRASAFLEQPPAESPHRRSQRVADEQARALRAEAVAAAGGGGSPSSVDESSSEESSSDEEQMDEGADATGKKRAAPPRDEGGAAQAPERTSYKPTHLMQWDAQPPNALLARTLVGDLLGQTKADMEQPPDVVKNALMGANFLWKMRNVYGTPMPAMYELAQLYADGASYIPQQYLPPAHVRFDNMVGADEPIRMLKNAVEADIYFTRMAGESLNTVLLYGPPGTGKTQLVLALHNEFAPKKPGDANTVRRMVLIKAPASEMKSPMQGVTAKNFDVLFRTAELMGRRLPGEKASAIVLVFVDEIDLIAPGRSIGGGKSGADTSDSSALQVLLTRTDSINTSGGEVLRKYTRTLETSVQSARDTLDGLIQSLQKAQRAKKPRNARGVTKEQRRKARIQTQINKAQAALDDINDDLEDLRKSQAPRVIFMCATNAPESIDVALLSRMNKSIHVSLPDFGARFAVTAAQFITYGLSNNWFPLNDVGRRSQPKMDLQQTIQKYMTEKVQVEDFNTKITAFIRDVKNDKAWCVDTITKPGAPVKYDAACLFAHAVYMHKVWMPPVSAVTLLTHLAALAGAMPELLVCGPNPKVTEDTPIDIFMFNMRVTVRVGLFARPVVESPHASARFLAWGAMQSRKWNVLYGICALVAHTTGPSVVAYEAIKKIISDKNEAVGARKIASIILTHLQRRSRMCNEAIRAQTVALSPTCTPCNDYAFLVAEDPALRKTRDTALRIAASSIINYNMHDSSPVVPSAHHLGMQIPSLVVEMGLFCDTKSAYGGSFRDIANIIQAAIDKNYDAVMTGDSFVWRAERHVYAPLDTRETRMNLGEKGASEILRISTKTVGDKGIRPVARGGGDELEDAKKYIIKISARDVMAYTKKSRNEILQSEKEYNMKEMRLFCADIVAPDRFTRSIVDVSLFSRPRAYVDSVVNENTGQPMDSVAYDQYQRTFDVRTATALLPVNMRMLVL